MLHCISLEDALARLTVGWTPSPAALHPRAALVPDRLAELAGEAGQRVTVQPVAPWETSTDLEMLAAVEALDGPLRGELVFITEASFGVDVGAFLVDATELPAFLEEHQRLHEPVFNGDTIIGIPGEGRVLCLHHGDVIIAITRP
ncbi:MAG: hypothetical protein HOO96_34475 [Polyangiaceae bacterium]|nr:hypothetical protein [Polyangiaceae bacterium]